MKRSAVFVVAFLVVAAGCSTGTHQNARTTELARLPELRGSLSSLAVTDAGPAAAIVQASAEGSHKTRLFWVEGSGSDVAATEVPSEDPLLGLITWWTGSEVMVLGLKCPKWADGGPEPTWGYPSSDNALKACGTNSYILESWSPATHKWSTHDASKLKSGNGYTRIYPHGDTAVLTENDDGPPTFVLLDATSGAIRPLPEPPDARGSAEVNFTPCLDSRGEPFAAVSWTGPTPPFVADQHWLLSLGKPMTDLRAGETGRVMALEVLDNKWTPMQISGRVGNWTGFAPVCSAQGVTGGLPGKGSTIQRHGHGARSVPLPGIDSLGQDQVIRMLRAEGSGTPILAAPSSTDRHENSDEPFPVQAWRLESNQWIFSESVQLGTSSFPFLVGTSIGSMEPAGTTGSPVSIELP